MGHFLVYSIYMTNLATYTFSELSTLSPEQRLEHLKTWQGDKAKVRASKAANERNPLELFSLLNAYMTFSKGSKVSSSTLDAYRVGIVEMCEGWQDVNLLHADVNEGVNLVRSLESRETSNSPALVRLRLAAFRALYRALRWVKAAKDTVRPFEGVSPAKHRTSTTMNEDAAYTLGELNLLVSQLHTAIDKTTSTSKQAKYQDLIRVMSLGAYAGLRVAEILSLTDSDIDLTQGQESVTVTGKGNKTRKIELSSRLIPLLKDIDGKIIKHLSSASNIRKMLVTQCENAEITYRHIHGFRHLFGMEVYEASEDLALVAELMGHASVDTTRRYAKPRSKTKRKAITAAFGA